MMAKQTTKTKAVKSRPIAKPPSIGKRALASARQALAHARGQDVPGFVVWKSVDVRAVRQKTGLSQPKFAETFGLDVSAVRDWEQKRRLPERTAQILLRIIDKAPNVVIDVVNDAA